jgi:hypothetical protein
MAEGLGTSLVRRFTDEIEGTTTLEQSVKIAQAQDDLDQKASEGKRLVQLLDDADRGGLLVYSHNGYSSFG